MNYESRTGVQDQPEPPNEQDVTMSGTTRAPEGVSLEYGLRRAAESERELESPTPKEVTLDNESI